MPNTIALLALAVWPIITVILFRVLPPARAFVWCVLAGYLFLPPVPAAFDLPLLPPFNKYSVINLSLAAVFLVRAGRITDLVPRQGWLVALSVLFVVSPVLTVLTNGEPIVFERAFLPGLGASDAIALSINQAIALVGFLVGQALIRSRDDIAYMLWALCVAGLVYSLPMLLEIRLSPQLNTWIYGYFQASFDQMIRGGGFRPLVFLEHGIWTAFFIMTAFIAALAFRRVAPPRDRPRARVAVQVADAASDSTPQTPAPALDNRYLLAAGYLGVVLVLSKTLGPLLQATALAPLVFFLGPRRQVAIAALLGLLVLVYPAMKATAIAPTDFLVAQAERIDPERARSLEFRFHNEDQLFERAVEKPLFGWGSWGRPQLHDPVTGELTSVTDGRWIITLGVYGWVGFIAEFGLLLLPLALAWRAVRRGTDAGAEVGAVALILGANMIDLIPNATLTPVTWMLAAALAGWAGAAKPVTATPVSRLKTVA